MGVAVAAAGSLLGSYAGGKLMGLDKKAPPGGGIPGVTASKGGGKDGTEGSVPQVDVSGALSYFKQAADTQQQGYNQGLSYYKDALKKATDIINTSSLAANNTLTPLSYSAGQALNEQMRMLGLDPIQATASFGQTLKAGYGAVADDQPLASTYISKLTTALESANNIKDPDERKQARTDIMNQFNASSEGIVKPIQAQIDSLQAPTQLHPSAFGGVLANGDANFVRSVMNSAQAATGVKGGGFGSQIYNGQQYIFVGGGAEQWLNAQDQYKTDLANYQSKLSALQEQKARAQEYAQGVTEFGNSWDANYADKYDTGYSAQQVTDKIASLPGYQFQLDQGTQALTRQAAARGMSQSGNLGAALQQFGQGQATNYFNQYMTYLQGIEQLGTPATMQISANQTNTGAALSTLAQTLGAAQMDTARSIADYSANSLMHSGDVYNQTAMYNTGLQFQGQENQKNRDAQAANSATSAAIGSGPGYLNAATNAAAYNNAFSQQIIQQAGRVAGFLKGLN